MGFNPRRPPTHVRTVTLVVDALHLCCCMGLVYVGKMSKAEPHQLQNSEFGAFIYAHNCVGD